METSIVLGSEQKPAGLRMRQQMHNSSTNLTITGDGLLDLTTGTAQGRATAFKHLMVPKSGILNRVLDQVDIGVSYATDADDVLGSARAKKSYTFGSKSGSKGGSAALEFFGEADVNTEHKTTTRGRVQLTSKVFNFTDRQDLKLTAGYGHRRKDISSEFIKGPYGCVQENNWTLVTDFKKYWHVTYDL